MCGPYTSVGEGFIPPGNFLAAVYAPGGINASLTNTSRTLAIFPQMRYSYLN